jgi:clan AA aspartic protease
MITGTVTSSYEPVVRLAVLGPQGQSQEIEAIVDTGFTGSFTLPPDLISTLGLVPRGQGFGVLADGQRILFEVFEAEVLWDTRPRRITIYAADSTPLLGMDLLDGYELTMQVIQGGTLSIRALPVS